MELAVETYEDIGVTRLSRWIFNCYLIHDGGDGRPVVVDAGLAGIEGDLRTVMAGLGLDTDGLASVCATHAHSDHVGGAPGLSTAARCPVHLPQQCRAYLEGATPRSPGPSGIARIWPTLLDQAFDAHGAGAAVRGARIAGYGTRGGMRWPSDRAPEFFAAGTTMPGAPGWQVLAAPGHTDDSVAFWNPETRALLSGDAVITVDGRAWITPETVDAPAGAATGARLRDLDATHLLPGHGRPIHGDGVMEAALTADQRPATLSELPRRLLRCFAGPGRVDS